MLQILFNLAKNYYMGLFDVFSNRKNATIKNLQRELATISSLVNANLNSMTIFPSYLATENADRYCTTDDVYSIISYLATTSSLIPIYPYTKDKDGKLTYLPENDNLALLMEMPFYGMTKVESLYAIYATRLMQGECIILKERPEFGPNKGKVTKLHYLPPQNVSIQVSDNFPKKIVAYNYMEDGVEIFTDIPVEDIIHMKYFNPITNFSADNFRGLSPLKVLSKRLTRVDSNNDVSTAQLQNGGVPGIVYEKTNHDNVVEVVGKRKDNFYKYLTNSNNKGAPYFSNGELGYIELGLKLADLSVAELEKIDFKKLCNVFRVSDRLFNNDATGSEISDKGARVGLYTNAVLPEVKAVISSLTKDLINTDFKGQNIVIKEDISEIYELQQNVQEMASAFAQLPIMIPSQILAAFNLEDNGDPLNEKIYVKSGYSLLEDVGSVAPLENTGDYANNNV